MGSREGKRAALIFAHLAGPELCAPGRTSAGASSAGRRGSTGRLAGKLAVVTGGSGGLGGDICEEFAREGADLVIGCEQASSWRIPF